MQVPPCLVDVGLGRGHVGFDRADFGGDALQLTAQLSGFLVAGLLHLVEFGRELFALLFLLLRDAAGHQVGVLSDRGLRLGQGRAIVLASAGQFFVHGVESRLQFGIRFG